MNKIQTHFIQDEFCPVIPDDEDLTIPGQSISVSDIVWRACNGLPIDCSQYQDSEISPYEDFFDLADEQMKRESQNQTEKDNDDEPNGEPAEPNGEEDVKE